MSPESFVEALVSTVHRSSMRGVAEELAEGPAGRRLDTRSKELTNWYAGLSPEDRRNVLAVIARSVHAAVFGFLCVVDGVRAIEDGGATELEVFAKTGADRVLLNSRDAIMLHEEYQALVLAEVLES
jgi:hypothetical protein